MNWISKVLEIVSSLLGLWKGKVEEKREQVKKEEAIKESAEYKERVQKNQEIKSRDNAEVLVSEVKNAKTEQERQAAIEQIRKRVSK